MEAIKKCILPAAIILLGIVALSSWSFLFDAGFFQFKTWYPSWYVPAYFFVKAIFPLLLGYCCLIIWAERTTFLKSTPAAFTVAFITVVVVECWGLRSAFYIAAILYAVYYAYSIRDVIAGGIAVLIYHKSTGLYLLIVLLVVVFSITGRILFAAWAENSSQIDGSCRFLISHIWATYYLGYSTFDKILNPNIDWLPLHFYVTGIAWKITNSQKAILVLHTIAGTCGAGVLYKISRLFASKENSLLSAAAYLLYPLNIFTATATMSEPWFITALLGVVYSFIKLTTTDQTKYYVLYVVFMGAACLLRYEGWPLVVMLPFIHLGWRMFYFNRKQLFFALALAFPLAIMYLNYYQGYHPLRGILYSDAQVAYCYNKSGRTLEVLMQGYKDAWIPGIICMASIAIFKHRQNSLLVLYSIIVGAVSLPFIYKLATFSIIPDSRYALAYIILLIPLFVKGFFDLTRKLTNDRLLIKLSLSGCLLFAVCFGYRFTSINSFKFPAGFNGSVEYVNKLPTGRFILDHHGGVKSYSWVALTHLPLLPVYEHWYLKQFIDFSAVRTGAMARHVTNRAIIFAVTDYEKEFSAISYGQIDKLLYTEKDIYLVLFPGRPLSKYFNFKNEHETYKQFSFKRVFTNSGYNIYKLL